MAEYRAAFEASAITLYNKRRGRTSDD